ncbi:organic solvent ABC transporter [Luteimonas aestuarii]|uniref:Organic solvent ABC transporter n=1 Tax=Luteimonas aestuarii TaxID=453837 RepID=A0A4R5TQK7_9GAMM|nr:ABC transporter substrate-binding protein [Luteimonas aestuarii]TDK23757.1 organic solvent ABC transporter [Luteimonas aestuarii]
MTPRNFPRKALALALSAIVFAAAAPALSFAQAVPAASMQAASMNGSPSKLVLDNTQRVLATLESRRAEFTRDRAALSRFITSEFDAMFDREHAARLVLGRHARGAAEADVKLFGDALAENLLQRYGSSLLDFNTRLQVRIRSETPLPRDAGVRVASELLRSGGDPIPVDYLMRRVGNEWRVFDVMVEGVSMVQIFRQQFDNELQRKSIRQVAGELRSGQLRATAD